MVVWDRATGTPVAARDRLAGPSHGGALSRARDRERREITARTGLRRRSVFLGDEDRVDASRRNARAARRRRASSWRERSTRWLIWRLTGGRVHATDPTNASRTLLYRHRRDALERGACALFGVPTAMLPEVRPSAGVVRHDPRLTFSARPCRSPASPATNRRRCSARGAWKPGEAKNTYGTGAFLLLNTGQQRPRGGAGMLTTVAWTIDGRPGVRARGRRSSLRGRRCSGCATGWASSATRRDRGARSLDPVERRRVFRARARRARRARLGA